MVSKVRHTKRALRPYPDDLICRALLTTELQSIFENAPQAPSSLAHDNVREAYARAAGKAPELTPADSRRRIPGPEDSCPICYECMHGVSQDKLVFCEECGNALHTECFGQCSLSTVSFLLSILITEPSPRLFAGRRCAAQLTCVWCRAKWPSGAKSTAGAGPTSEGYINLGSIAGVSGQRDTSSCELIMFILLPCPLMTPLRPSGLAIRRKGKSCLTKGASCCGRRCLDSRFLIGDNHFPT